MAQCLLLKDSRLRFLLASGLAATISIALIELARVALDLANPWLHVGSVALSYFVAARINFELQQRWTFGRVVVVARRPSFITFVVVNGSMSLIVGALSAWLVCWAPLTQLAGPAPIFISLVVAALAMAPLSFVLTRRLVQDKRLNSW